MEKYLHLIDFNSYPASKRTYAGFDCKKLGISFRNENWFLKFPKPLHQSNDAIISYSTAPLAEFIGCHIYQILGFDVQQTLLGFKDDMVVVCCK